MNISFNKREAKNAPSLPHVIESRFIPNRAVEIIVFQSEKDKVLQVYKFLSEIL
jgi:hypothetical protein